MQGLKIKFLAVVFTFIGLAIANPAYAACDNPAGLEGDQVYNSTSNLMQFCNGSIWIGMARVEGGEGSGDSLGNHIAKQNLDAAGSKIINLGAPVDGTDAANKAYLDSLSGTAETDPQVGTLTAGKWCVGNGTLVNCTTDDPDGLTPGIFIAIDQRSSGTSVASGALNSWVDHALSTVLLNTVSGAGLATNLISLPAGTYYIDATVPLYSGGVVGTRLFNQTSNTALLNGTTGGQSPHSVIRGTFVLSGTSTIKIQHYETTTGGAHGLGRAASAAGVNETYLTVSIRRVAEGVKQPLAETACYASFVESNTCTSASDPQQVLFQYTGGVNKSQCAALCEDAGATCCSHVTGTNACVGTKTAVLSGGPAGSSATACENCVKTKQDSHFLVRTAGTWNGNLGGLAGATAKCLADLQANDWQGKSTVTLNSTTVKAFFCAGGTCNSLSANKTYNLAVSGDPSKYGLPFTTDSNGFGPNNSDNWSTVLGPVTYWMNRSNTGNGWNNTEFSTTNPYKCNGYTDGTTWYMGVHGLANSTDDGRFVQGSAQQCNNQRYLLCAVSQDAATGTCPASEDSEGCEKAFKPIIAMGGAHACAIGADYKTYCWGRQGTGVQRLGDGTTANRTAPATVLNGANSSGMFQQVVGGTGHSCAIGADNKAYCWGDHNYGALGDGTATSTHTAVAVSNGANASGTYKQLSANQHTCGLDMNGKAYCWGRGDGGQIGDGSAVSRTTPVAVLNGENPTGTYKQISVAYDHSCGLGMDSKVYCWGKNGSGQVGDNSKTQRNSPVLARNGANPTGTYKQISTGDGVTCGIGMNDYVYCWGSGGGGLLAGSYGTDQITPVAATNGGGPSTFKQISSGNVHSCGIATDDKAYCWGNNTYGGIGNGGTSTAFAPTLVLNGANSSGTYKNIAAGSYVTCAIGTNNRQYCWGGGAAAGGNLGGGSGYDVSTPVAVGNGTNTSGTYKSIEPWTCPGLSPCEEVGGKYIGGFCWIKSGANKSCDQTCSAAGSTCNLSGTKDYAGSGGSNTNCLNILDALGKTGSGSVTDSTSYFGLACNWDGSGERSRITSPTTSCSAYAPNIQQACACDLGNVPVVPTPGYFVISDTVKNGDFRGIAAANSLCLANLKTKLWKGKSNATLNSTTVKAFLCTDTLTDPSVCNNLKPNKEYFFGAMGSLSTGGASMTADASGIGPNNANNWSSATHFGTTGNYWSGRLASSSTKWGAGSGLYSSCTDWTDGSMSSMGLLGGPNNTNGDRFNTQSAYCNFTNRYVCMVHPSNASSTNDCTYAGGYEVGGACWFLGDVNQTCTTVCAGIGGTYNSATESYGGSGGLNTNCDAIMDAFGAGGNSTTTISNAGGCYISEANAGRYRGTATTTAAYSSGTAHRACACNPPAMPTGPTCTTSGGVEVGGACWFLAEENQGCGDMCTAVGGTYNASGPTVTYAGSGGSNANCGSVLTALSASGSGNSSNITNTMGCQVVSSTRRRGTTATAEAVSASNVRRVCACDFSGDNPFKKVFVTNGTWNGNLGGVAGANTKCQTEATSAGLTGTYKAWISAGATTPVSNFTQSAVPYKRIDGATIAQNWNDLIDGSLENSINVTASGSTVAGSRVWTNTLPTGLAGTSSCGSSWTVASGVGINGDTDGDSNDWTNDSSSSCSSYTARLYCFEQ